MERLDLDSFLPSDLDEGKNYPFPEGLRFLECSKPHGLALIERGELVAINVGLGRKRRRLLITGKSIADFLRRRVVHPTEKESFQGDVPPPADRRRGRNTSRRGA